jgi:hypothetical protein
MNTHSPGSGSKVRAYAWPPDSRLIYERTLPRHSCAAPRAGGLYHRHQPDQHGDQSGAQQDSFHAASLPSRMTDRLPSRLWAHSRACGPAVRRRETNGAPEGCSRGEPGTCSPCLPAPCLFPGIASWSLASPHGESRARRDVSHAPRSWFAKGQRQLRRVTRGRAQKPYQGGHTQRLGRQYLLERPTNRSTLLARMCKTHQRRGGRSGR